MKPRLLDLCCKAGGASVGYARAGWDVTGVDIEDQPSYPFRFFRADALTFPLEGYDAIHASPPCGNYGRTRHLDRCKHPLLIEEIRERLVDSGALYVIENVMGAPLRSPLRLYGGHFGLTVRRMRLFESNVLLLAPGPCYSSRGPVVPAYGHWGSRDSYAAALGIDWMGTREELAAALPPVYCEFIGRQLLAALQHSLTA